MNDLGSIETPADLLRTAASVLRDRGHTRYVLEDSQGQVCFNGALYAAAGNHEIGWYKRPISGWFPQGRDQHYRHETAFGAMRRLLNENPVHWNNEIALDAEDVASHMEKAAALWEETGDLQSG